jgi:hypothetical protein
MAPIGVVNISDAKTQLSKLMDEAAAGNFDAPQSSALLTQFAGS